MSDQLTSDFHEKLDADALMAVLGEAQETVRSYDTKAEICGVGFILAVGIVKQSGDSIPIPIEWASLYVLAGWMVIVIPIIMFALVLYPSRISKMAGTTPPEGVQGVMYFDRTIFSDITAYAESMRHTDWAREIIFEITKVSNIRDTKRKRFLRALYWAGGSFTVLFLSQMIRANGGLN